MEYPIYSLQQLAHTLKGRRKARRKTQAQTGAMVGVLPKTISALETSPGTRTIESLFKVISALDLEIVLREKGKDHAASDKPGTPEKLEW